MDLTASIMVNAPTHDLSKDSEKAAMRYRNGDILAVYDTLDLANFDGTEYRFREPITSPRSVFIHMLGVPNNLANSVKQRLPEPIQAAADTIRRKRYRIPPSVMPLVIQNALRDNREVTMTWTQAKTLIRKKSITVPLDATRDDERAELRDADMR